MLIIDLHMQVLINGLCDGLMPLHARNLACLILRLHLLRVLHGHSHLGGRFIFLFCEDLVGGFGEDELEVVLKQDEER